ncbi:hypothetical protein TorRG33x02_070840, partial [Trema orientale]
TLRSGNKGRQEQQLYIADAMFKSILIVVYMPILSVVNAFLLINARTDADYLSYFSSECGAAGSLAAPWKLLQKASSLQAWIHRLSTSGRTWTTDWRVHVPNQWP